VLGPLRADVAAETGLKGTIVVAPGSHDTASAVVGAPLSGPTTAFLSSGTWSLIGLEIARPMVSDASLAANLTNEGGVADTIRLLRNVMGLWLIQESRRAMWPSGEGPSYGELAALAETAPAFTAFIDPDDPRFLPAGDVPARVRAFCRETGQPEPPDAATLMRVLLESLALRYAQTIDELVAASGQRIEKIHVVGGGSKHQLLCRLTAGATGLPVQAGPAEATAIGNIVVQAIGAGELASIAEARDLIAKSFPLVLYEPGGDWAEARERFARCAPRVAPEPALEAP
ncbi:MAG: rhamnulokinase, partial [Aeromicrobium sp.]